MGSHGGTRWWLHEQEKIRFSSLESASSPCICGSKRVQQRHEYRQHTRHPEPQHHTRRQELQQRRRRKGGEDGEQQVQVRQSQKPGGILLHARNEPAKGGVCVSGCVLPGECRGGAAYLSTVSFVCWLILLFLLVWETRVAPSGDGFSASALAPEARHYDDSQVLASPLKRRPKEKKRDLLPTVSFAKGEQSFAESLLSSAAAREPWTTEAAAPPVPFPGTEEIYEMQSSGSRVLALGDLHGDIFNSLLVLSGARLINPDTLSWTGGDAVLIQTGDVLDRGERGTQLLEYFRRLSQEARAAGGRVVQLLGNHELMNACGLFHYAHPAETAMLGGLENRKKLFRFGTGRYGKMLASFLVAVKVDEIVFSHAGILPSYAKLGLRELTRRVRTELQNDCYKYLQSVSNPATAPGAPLVVSGPNGPLWTRAFATGTLEEVCSLVEESLKELKAKRMVVGHNVQTSHHIETFCNGKLIAIDTGLSSAVANSPSLLEVRYGALTFEWSVPSPPRPLFTLSTLLSAPAMARTRPLVTPPTQGEGPSTSQARSATSSIGSPPQRGTLAPGGEGVTLRRWSLSRPRPRSMGEEVEPLHRSATVVRRRSTSVADLGSLAPRSLPLPAVRVTTPPREEPQDEGLLPWLLRQPRPPRPQTPQPSEPPSGRQSYKDGASKGEEL